MLKKFLLIIQKEIIVWRAVSAFRAKDAAVRGWIRSKNRFERLQWDKKIRKAEDAIDANTAVYIKLSL